MPLITFKSLSKLYIVHGVLHNVVKATETKERLGTILIARDDLETTLRTKMSEGTCSE